MFRLCLFLLCWLGAALRVRGLFANSFHADEALFAGWARLIAVWRDPLLQTQLVDKPPLLFYTQALFYPLAGPEEWAARLPSLVASLLLIPLTAQLAWRLTGDRVTAVLAAAVVAVAPLAVQFSATAFSDPLLTFWLTVALCLAVRPVAGQSFCFRPFLAGLCFGLALATKYQAFLFLPLLGGLAWLTGWRRGEAARWLMGMGLALAVLLLWMVARAGAPGPVALQWANVGGLRLAWSWELWPRLADTARLWRLALGWPLLLLAGALAIGLPLFLHRLRPSASEDADSALAHSAPPLPRPPAPLLLLPLFILAYTLLHWLWAVPLWDRYLLPLLPLVAVLLGRGVSLALAAMRAARPVWGRAAAALLVAVAALHAPVMLAARAGRHPIGGGPAADGGAAAVARLLEDAPYGTVLYDHWYSWQWRYHLFDRRVYVSWFLHADALLDDLAVFGGGGAARYVALPASAAARPVARRLAEAGYGLEPVAGQDGTASMTLFRIVTEEAAE
ncbi:ArnT family glycosyltransferase [Promineifilum sp.]|uniref:ArnT family glycosyltransferase n=1 Tax=Promineifilum sp. TaxID=2664178 RepID=UPI0035B10B83